MIIYNLLTNRTIYSTMKQGKEREKMKSIIKYIIAGIFAVVFSAPAFAQNYAHTIEHLMFECYEYYGISATVTTNIDTEGGMTLYVAIYSRDGQLLEVSSTPLKQTETDVSIVYNLKVSTTLDESMTVKGMIWKDMKVFAEPKVVKYDKKYDSGNGLLIPEVDFDYTVTIPGDVVKDETGLEDYLQKSDDIPSRVIEYEILPSEKIDDVTVATPDTYNPDIGKDWGNEMSPDEHIEIDFLCSDGNLDYYKVLHENHQNIHEKLFVYNSKEKMAFDGCEKHIESFPDGIIMFNDTESDIFELFIPAAKHQILNDNNGDYI